MAVISYLKFTERIIIISTLVLILYLDAQMTNKGACQKASGECCTNYRLKMGICVACEPGYFGDNCKDQCPYPLFGVNCGNTCQCINTSCNISYGCVDYVSEDGLETTSPALPTSVSSTTTEDENKVININTSIIEEETTTIYHNTISISSTTPSSLWTSSPVILVVIVATSVLSLFLIVIIINQSVGHFRSRNVKVIKSEKPGHNQDEETYLEINESAMLPMTVNYSKIKKKNHAIEMEEYKKPIIESVLNGKESPASDDSLERIKSIDTASTEVNVLSDKLNVGEKSNSETNDDDSYLTPSVKQNTYIQVIDSVNGDTDMIKNSSKADVSIETHVVAITKEESSTLETNDSPYLDVIHS